MGHKRHSAVLTLAVAGAAIYLFGRVAARGRSTARNRFEPLAAGNGSRSRVVVIGAGFGGLQAALSLAEDPDVDLTVIDVHNHHLFQPLLYQVATAALSPSDIAAPLRAVLPMSDRTRVVMAAVTAVDTQHRRVFCDDERSFSYDELIIATGSQPSYFGHDEWAEAAPSMKTLGDALRLRDAILSVFERAALSSTQAEQARLLTFVLIGAGPTGVEMAGSIAELAHDLLTREYTIGRARIVLLDAGRRVLAEFPPDLSANAAASLKALGVEVRTGQRVTDIEDGKVQLEGEAIEAGMIVWTAGTSATPVAQWLGITPGHGGRVDVERDLRVPGYEDVSVIGDAALAKGADGKPLPGLAPVAKQQGEYVAQRIRRRLRRQPAPAPFVYRDYGTLATIGRNKAVAEFGPLHLTGRPAWLMWAGAHIFFLISFRNRVLVTAQWAFAYATHQRSAGLIVGNRQRQPGGPHPPVAKPG